VTEPGPPAAEPPAERSSEASTEPPEAEPPEAEPVGEPLAEPTVVPSDDVDDRAPLWARIVGFAALMALFIGIVAVVLVRDRGRTEASGTTGATADTVALPAGNGGSVTTTTTVPTPTGDDPTTRPRQPRTNNDVALAVERALKLTSGFVYKASCLPQGTVARDDVLECFVASEPPVNEAPAGSVLAVVVDDQGHVIWTHKNGNDDTLDALRAQPGLSCDDLAAKAEPWTYVFAYWLANGRPAALDPDGTGRPCDGRYSSADIDQALAATI
jgi:hypothetical protein